MWNIIRNKFLLYFCLITKFFLSFIENKSSKSTKIPPIEESWSEMIFNEFRWFKLPFECSKSIWLLKVAYKSYEHTLG